MKLLNVDNNAKTIKGQKRGFLTGVLYLAPAKLSGFEVCPQRTAGCTKACLNTAGHGVFSNVQEARVTKTKLFFSDRAAFIYQLAKEIAALVRKAEREGLTPTVRLNGTSDIPWERIPVKSGPWSYANIFEVFPDVQFYDYTKITKRALAHARGEMPGNYHLTFSLAETNDADAVSVLEAGGNVAAVFAPHLPTTFTLKAGPLSSVSQVIDGDYDDVRFDNATPQGFASVAHRGVIVGLKAKGKARKDTLGFVRRV